MPDHIPDVAVVDDRLVVYLFVVLFAAALLLALFFARPWAQRVPSVTAGDHGGRQPTPPRSAERAPGAAPSLPSPWSTAQPDDAPPWRHADTIGRED
jgi:hypothetical protein